MPQQRWYGSFWLNGETDAAITRSQCQLQMVLYSCARLLPFTTGRITGRQATLADRYGLGLPVAIGKPRSRGIGSYGYDLPERTAAESGNGDVSWTKQLQ